MKRYLAIAVLGIGYLVYRTGVVPALPAPPPPAVVASFPEVSAAAQKMRPGDRAALADAYLIFSRAVAANPTLEPVFPDTAAVRRAHRAVLLYVWAAVLQNKAGEVPGLREALESAVAGRIGTEDVPLNPDLQAQTATALADIAASIR